MHLKRYKLRIHESLDLAVRPQLDVYGIDRYLALSSTFLNGGLIEADYDD